VADSTMRRWDVRRVRSRRDRSSRPVRAPMRGHSAATTRATAATRRTAAIRLMPSRIDRVLAELEAMRFRLLFLGALACLAAACGSTKTATKPVTTTVPAPAATTTAPVSPSPMAVTVFRVDNGLLRPSVVHVPRTPAVAGAALGALDIGAGAPIDA